MWSVLVEPKYSREGRKERREEGRRERRKEEREEGGKEECDCSLE